MKYGAPIAVMLTVTALAPVAAGAAAEVSAFQAAYAAATQAEQQAGALQNRWTVTEEALQQARKAAAAKQYDAATALARKAEALARLSVQQAEQQKTAWTAEADLVR